MHSTFRIIWNLCGYVAETQYGAAPGGATRQQQPAQQLPEQMTVQSQVHGQSWAQVHGWGRAQLASTGPFSVKHGDDRSQHTVRRECLLL